MNIAGPDGDGVTTAPARVGNSFLWNVVLIVGAMTLLTSYGKSQRKKFLTLPPGPRNWPIIGILPTMKPSMYKAFQTLAGNYGPVVYFRLGFQEVVLVSSAEVAEELLKQKDAKFAHRDAIMTRTMGKYTGFDSILFPYANYNALTKLLRRIATTEFFTVAKLKIYEGLRSHEMAVMVEKIFGDLDSNSNTAIYHDHRNASNSTSAAAKVGIRDAVAAMILNLICLINFGKRFDDLPETDKIRQFPALLVERMSIFMKFNLVAALPHTNFIPSLEWLDPQGSLKEYKNFYKRQRKFFWEIVEEHRRVRRFNHDSGHEKNNADEAKSRNFVDVLLDIQEEGGKVSDDAVMATVASMLYAGIDTSSATIEWVLLELVRHPQLLKRLHNEIDEVVGKERPVEEADIPTMPFLNAVVMESFRLNSAIAYTFPHVNLQPSTLGGYSIPAGTAVIVNIYGIGRDPTFWKDPLKFSTDRFLQNGLSDGMKPNGSDYHLLPFGSGRRGCPGYNLGIIMVLRAVATLVHAFDWFPPSGTTISELNKDTVGSIVLRPKSELLLTSAPRLSRHIYQSKI